MKLQFLGHGLTDENEWTVGNYLRSSFKDDAFNSFKGFVAFTTLSGLSIFIDELEQAKETYREIELFLGVDDKATSKEALEELLKRKVDTYIFHNPTLKTRKIFHPKIYLFKGELSNRLIIGSSNLTRPGLFHNIEASIVVEYSNGDPQGLKLERQIETYFSSLIDKTHHNLKKLDHLLINYLISSNLISGEKQIFQNEEEAETNNPPDDNGEQVFITEEASNVDLDTIDFIETTEENESQPSSKKKNKVPLTEYYFYTWSILFEKYKQYILEHNTTIVPRDYANPSLYRWYVNQKILYNDATMPEEHFEKLIDIDFPFENTARNIRLDKIWEEKYNKLKEYYLIHGHTAVPRKKSTLDDISRLATWVAFQRFFKKWGDKRLTQYRIDKLNELNFNWEIGYRNEGVTQDQEKKWLEQLEVYVQFKKINQREPKQKRNTPEYSIARWRNDQIVAKSKNKLSATRAKLLEDAGIIWDLEEFEFQQKIEKLLEYKKEFGNFDVPLEYEKDKSLGQFVYGIRKKGTTEERKRTLEKLGVTGVILRSEAKKFEKKQTHITTEWLRNFKQLKILEKQNIDINKITRDYPADSKFGNWLANQKKRYRLNQLNEEQEELLHNTTLVLTKEDPWQSRWQVFFELLEEYVKVNGHSRVPPSYDQELSNWCRTQRKSYRNKELTNERIEKLNSIQFEWTVANGKTKNSH